MSLELEARSKEREELHKQSEKQRDAISALRGSVEAHSNAAVRIVLLDGLAYSLMTPNTEQTRFREFKFAARQERLPSTFK